MAVKGSIYTLDDLKQMQGWTLEQKIAETQRLIREWYRYYDGKVYISFSAGKDSTLLLYLARELYPDIPAVFVDTGCEYPENIAFAKATQNVKWLYPDMPFENVLQVHGYPVISKEVAKRIYYARKGSNWAIQQLQGFNTDGSYSKFNQRYKKWGVLMDAPFPISEKCCNELKIKPLNRFQRESGLKTIVGTMACESTRRQSAFLLGGCNVYREKYPSSKPLSFWLEDDVLHCIKQMKIPYSRVYGDIVFEKGRWKTTGAHRTGCIYCTCGAHLEKQPNRFQRMAQTHPEEYAHCIDFLGYGRVLDYLGIVY